MDAAPRYCGIAVVAFIILASFGLQRLTADQRLHTDVRVPTFQHVDPDSRHRRVELDAFGVRDNEYRRNELRRAVLEAAR